MHSRAYLLLRRDLQDLQRFPLPVSYQIPVGHADYLDTMTVTLSLGPRWGWLGLAARDCPTHGLAGQTLTQEESEGLARESEIEQSEDIQVS